MKELIIKINKYVPAVPMIIFTLLPIAALIHIIGAVWVGFADFFNVHIASIFRAMLAYLTGWIPFSTAETILLFLPVVLVVLIIFIIPKATSSKAATWRYLTSLISVVAYIYIIFVFTFALGYQGSPVSDKLGMEERLVSADELYFTAMTLNGIVNELADEVEFNYGSSSVMPYSHSEMTDKLNDAYERAAEKYYFIKKLRSNVKQIVLSEPMTYTHISGVYTFFTGEANINMNFPDYTIPFTAAHEMSHQRGIAPENEANFMAFLVCVESDDPYIRYSGYQNLLEYVYSALSRADSALYSDCYSLLDGRVKSEMRAYNAFFDKYEDNVAATISGAVNDTYLKIQGTEGTRSYGLVADLAVVYFCDGFYEG